MKAVYELDQNPKIIARFCYEPKKLYQTERPSQAVKTLEGIMDDRDDLAIARVAAARTALELARA